MVTIYPTKDSFTYESDPTVNYGSGLNTYVKTGTGIRRRTYTEFDISSYSVDGISQAIFWIYLDSGVYSPRTWLFERITSSWVENTITWNLVPTATATNSTTEGVNYSGTPYWESIDVTNMLKDETGSSFGIRTMDTLDASESDEYGNGFNSREAASNKPYLVLTISDKYVDIATGSDADDGNSWVNAYLTAKKGIDNISSPAILHIAEGDYSAQAAIDLNKNLELICEDYGGGNASPPLTVVLPVTT